MEKAKLIALLRLRAVKKLAVMALGAGLLTFGVAVEPEVADALFEVAVIVGETL